MGTYINPGNSGFEEILKLKYVDKTGLIALINSTIGTKEKLTCVSRPRRFGKSYAAQMLSAYYDKECKSEELFKYLKISEDESFYKHLNKYNVINIDVTGFISDTQKEGMSVRDVPERIVNVLLRDIKKIYPRICDADSLNEYILEVVRRKKQKFIFIIDEWDAIIREARNDPDTQKRYLNLLRGWFKNGNFTSEAVAAAYMTGILPIKKDISQSAISDFREYTMIKPRKFGDYAGFTESEVMSLCEEYNVDFKSMKYWYDGYALKGTGSVYNPNSVMQAIGYRDFDSYWTKTSAAEVLMNYINMDFEGMQEITARLIAGEEIEINTDFFKNDFESFSSRDDVFTLMIHLGYLSYNADNKTIRIPNEEVRIEFNGILRGVDVNDKWLRLIKKSRRLLKDTVSGDADAVARAVEMIRDTEYAPAFYNDEQALRYIIKFAYIAAIDKYLKVEELPSGRGIADIVYIPKRRSALPALVIELKWDKSAGGAISQIKEKNYPAVLGEYGGSVVLVGINYNSKTKRHSCEIEECTFD